MRTTNVTILLLLFHFFLDASLAKYRREFANNDVITRRHRHSHLHRHLETHRKPNCRQVCDHRIHNKDQAVKAFAEFLRSTGQCVVTFHLRPNISSLLEEQPYMGDNVRGSEWIWACNTVSRKMLALPHDSSVLSMGLLSNKNKQIELNISSRGERCLRLLQPECRLDSIRSLITTLITMNLPFERQGHFLCNRVFVRRQQRRDFLHRCCSVEDYLKGDKTCEIYSGVPQEVSSVLTMIHVTAALLTLYSPVAFMKLKIALKFDNVTKFFRASLKHGITGQRNYVIRISSRQLINLSDVKPFSLPRILFRLLVHCYGEGRCCIHLWADWRNQPRICNAHSFPQRIYVFSWRFLTLLCIFPLSAYFVFFAYQDSLETFKYLHSFASQMRYAEETFYFHINIVGKSLLVKQYPITSIWMIFSMVAFLYVLALLMWPNNPLEKCLLHQENSKVQDRPRMLYDYMTNGYKNILYKLAYGSQEHKTHLFSLGCVPEAMKRSLVFTLDLIKQIPVLNICINLFPKHFKSTTGESSHNMASNVGIAVSWVLFLGVFIGYCSAVFIIIQFAFNVIFFTLMGAIIKSATILPWIVLLCVILFYVNDSLAMINREHKEVLKLIDQNSPRISALEETEEMFRDRTQILRKHNLGAVKFIDSDSTEYVSKELYYNVCNDLKIGWNRSMRKLLRRIVLILMFVVFVFVTFSALSVAVDGGIGITLLAAFICGFPKFLDAYYGTTDKRALVKSQWEHNIAQVLDKHIKVDRYECEDDYEQELSTYDVRPVGLLEMEVPRMQQINFLKFWKFSWVVSGDQQTPSNEGFILALANKLSAACFLSKIVTHAYSPDLEDESVLRQWCLVVENCILEGSNIAATINGAPLESIKLFPPEVQALVTHFNTGATVDNVVDAINQELYGPFTKGVLVTISNTSIALCKLDGKIFAFNSGCHGDQVTDLFGAVLLSTDFNTQNLQSAIKYMIDPYSPDTVPVYTIVPMEGFVFKSDIISSRPVI